MCYGAWCIDCPEVPEMFKCAVCGQRKNAYVVLDDNVIICERCPPPRPDIQKKVTKQ